MKLLYICAHPIPNLTPLFRELNKKDEISFKAVFWQNISADFHEPEFNKVINYGVDLFSGYDYFFLCNKKRNKSDKSFLSKLKIDQSSAYSSESWRRRDAHTYKKF